ncbi:MAG TPA: hypothetical protein VGT40_10945 [Methylomirabilota bacterium]|jgi:hypothetical protein|nr:hypothetical protein [Methylomirabilota bacterium]
MTVADPRIPTWVKVAYSCFVAIVVPCYWVTYTPWNFLYFCDVALLATAVAIWVESSLLLSMQAVAITLPQTLWVIDLLCRLVAGVHVTGVTSYMLDSSIPSFLRVLSSFHGWLPFVLLWLLSRLGYDRRALGAQSVVAVAVLLASYLFAPAPPPPASHPNWAVNINYVYGFDDKHPQTLMPPRLWLLFMMAVNVIALYVPTHLVLRRVFAPASDRLTRSRRGLGRASDP